MKKQIVNISPLQAAKVAAVLYLIISIPFVLIFALIGLGTMGTHGAGSTAMGLGMIIVFPIMYAVFGGLFTLIGAWVYNLVAGMTGGFEFTTREA